MIESARPPSKFLAAIAQIQEMIKTDRFQSGDKIPSERELSDRLSIGRSSVREALRALELLGLIETRRGEGTFLRDFKDHQLVPLIGTFIFDGDQNKEDVRDVKAILELGCLAILSRKSGFDFNEAGDSFQQQIEAADNRLLKNIWMIISDYAGSDTGNERLEEMLAAAKQINYSERQ
ncbi:GntR family transcriptional regulator [Domibacillus sp. A3M-37]|uniref:FadR/GntR family transcriptional regulator n=1 Tax=Domibacillus sp. A3M-37 TaxID=2962037 RepID=UPI0020B7CFEF|nr:GntR family transcriptional regulator [Domibacillus sp. A3M-37]MCP3762486.1 GntR family transcriptional regulator [Domibacillus sp. A3M-37]